MEAVKAAVPPAGYEAKHATYVLEWGIQGNEVRKRAEFPLNMYLYGITQKKEEYTYRSADDLIGEIKDKADKAARAAL